MTYQTFKQNMQSLKELVNDAKLPLAIGLTGLATIIGSNLYAHRNSASETEQETKAPITSTFKDTFFRDSYAPLSPQGDGDTISLEEKMNLILKGEEMYDPNTPMLRTMPEIRNTPEKHSQEPSYEKPIYQKSPVKKYIGNKLVNHRVKNNNPCNLKAIPGKKWAGQVGTDHRGFAIFKNEVYGLRSWLKNAGDLRDMYGTDTISELIRKCSPPHENDTNSYINFVAQNLGVSPNEKLDLTDKEQAVGLLAQITQKESSAQYPRTTLEKAYRMLYKN